MSGFRSLYNIVLSESNKNCWRISEDKKAKFENDELTIENKTNVKFLCVNLTKYKYFLVEMQFFNPTNYSFDIGLNERTAIFISNGPSYSNLYELKPNNSAANIVRKFDTNLFAVSNIWHKIRIEKRGKEGTFRVDENIFDLPDNSGGDYLYFRKWDDSFIKIKDIKILTTSLPSCYNHNKRRISFSVLSLCLLAIK